MLAFVDAANVVTLTGLWAAVATVLLAARQRPSLALAALVVSGLCDLADGVVARRLARTDAARRFGARLDSLTDACSFGLAPVTLLHALGLTHPAHLVMLALFASAAVWRLAYFDTVGLSGEGELRYYRGVPVTYAALVLPLAALAGLYGGGALRASLTIVTAALTLAMVSPLRIRKPTGAALPILAAVGVGLIATYVALDGTFPKV